MHGPMSILFVASFFEIYDIGECLKLDREVYHDFNFKNVYLI